MVCGMVVLRIRRLVAEDVDGPVGQLLVLTATSPWLVSATIKTHLFIVGGGEAWRILRHSARRLCLWPRVAMP